MRKFLVVLSAVVATACSSVVPDPGVEAVLTRKPILFGHGGVDPTPIKTGRSFVAWTTDATYVNMQPQRVDMQFDDLMTSNGVPIDFHAVFSYAVTDHSPDLDKRHFIYGWFNHLSHDQVLSLTGRAGARCSQVGRWHGQHLYFVRGGAAAHDCPRLAARWRFQSVSLRRSCWVK